VGSGFQGNKPGKRSKKGPKTPKLALKPISQRVYKRDIDSRGSSEPNETWLDALETSFGPSSASGGVAMPENR